MSSSILRSASRLLHSSAPATAQISATRRAADAVAAASAARVAPQSKAAAVAGFPQVAAHSTAPLVVPSPAHGASSLAPAARMEQPAIKGPGPQAVTKFAETD